MRILPGRRIWNTSSRNERERTFLGLFVGFLVAISLAVGALYIEHLTSVAKRNFSTPATIVPNEVARTISLAFVTSMVASIVSFLPVLAIMFIERRIRFDLGIVVWCVIGTLGALMPSLFVAGAFLPGAFVLASACASGGFAAAGAYAGRTTSYTRTTRIQLVGIVLVWAAVLGISYTIVLALDLSGILRSLVRS